MSYSPNNDFYLEVARGNVSGMSIVHKFGRNGSASTTLSAVSGAGVYMMPTSAVTLEAVSSSAQDNSAGAGARSLTIEGLDSSFNEISETLTMNGTSATSATSNSFIRVDRAYVASAGTYATLSTKFSHVGTITVRESGGGSTWTTLPVISANFGIGESEIACYTVPTGKTAYVLSTNITIEKSKTVDVYFMNRQSADDTTAPYSAMRILQHFVGLGDGAVHKPHAPIGAFPAKTDICFFAKTSAGTTAISVDFEILLIND